MTTAAKAKVRALDVLLAPLRWLERARGRRRLLLIVLYLIVGWFAALLIWVAASLNNLPDVGEPFDVAAFVASASVPDSENAFALYREAVGAYRDAPAARDWNRMWPAMRNGWATAGPDFQAWVLSNREALDLWRKGTERTRALAEPLDAIRSLEDGLDRKLSMLTEAAILEGARREAEGDCAAALDWYLAALRACVHYSTNSRLQWRNLAVMLEDSLQARMVAWSRDPATDAALLKRAVRAVAEIDAATPPVSGNLKAEYLAVNHALDDLPRLARRLDGLGGSTYSYAEMGRWHHVYWFVRREPERSRRVAKLFFANWLAYADVPSIQRPALIANAARGPAWGVYVPAPGASRAARAMEPRLMFAWLESTAMLWRFLPMYPYLNPASAEREQQLRGVLQLLIAEEAYRRDHAGQDPPSSEALVPEYLPALPEQYVEEKPPSP